MVELTITDGSSCLVAGNTVTGPLHAWVQSVTLGGDYASGVVTVAGGQVVSACEWHPYFTTAYAACVLLCFVIGLSVKRK
jgi:hypothetical protein